jgi:chromosome segregation ATPase
MFNKTSFPSIPFHFKTNKYNKVVVYDSKRLEQLTNPKLFDKTYHSSIDNRSTFLSDINSIIPDDILTSYDFFNRFRQFKNYTFENTNMDLLIHTPDTTSLIEDPRDKLIESYKQRLETTTKRAENAEKIMQTMLEEYEQKSVDIKTINYELQQIKLELLEKQSQYKKDLLEHETKQIMSYVNTIEDLKNSNFRLNQQLLEIESYKASTNMMGQSIDTLKKENATILLSLEKQKGMTEKLITQLKTEKNKNDNVIQQNTEYKNNYMSLETNYASLKNNLFKLEEQIKDKTLECSKMTDTFKQLGNTSTDALENALSEKIDTLITSNEMLKEENKKITIEYNKVSKQLEKLQSTLKNMLE